MTCPLLVLTDTRVSVVNDDGLIAVAADSLAA